MGGTHKCKVNVNVVMLNVKEVDSCRDTGTYLHIPVVGARYTTYQPVFLD